jgi:hypothetical protein
MTLPGDQNSETSLQLLAAQRQRYSTAKTLRSIRVYLSAIMAIAVPVLSYKYPVTTNYFAVTGGVWLLLSTLVLKRTENSLIQTAAKIQEQFDTQVFDLPWNTVLVGHTVSKELVISAAEDFTGDKEDLRNWYPDTSTMGLLMSILICQRSNIVSDWRLTRSYGYLVGIVTTAIFVVGIVVAVVTDQKLVDYLLKFLIPSLAILVAGIETFREHLEISYKKQGKEQEVNQLLEQTEQCPESLTLGQCRQLQDYIFCLRSQQPLVPDWYYKIRRERYERDMQQAAEEFSSEMQQE